MSDSIDSPESGLRARKKRRTEADILSNAIRLFGELGVRAARLSEIARASGVSPATLFNYFPNKAALAEAWVRNEIDRILVEVSQDLGDHGLRSAMRNLCRRLAELVSRERSVRLEAWREAGRARSAPLPLRHPIVLALEREQQRERVRGDLSARVLSEMLIDAIEGGLIAGLNEESSERELAQALRARVDLVLDGARKKNERVPAPAVAGGIRSGTRPTPPAPNR